MRTPEYFGTGWMERVTSLAGSCSKRVAVGEMGSSSGCWLAGDRAFDRKGILIRTWDTALEALRNVEDFDWSGACHGCCCVTLEA